MRYEVTFLVRSFDQFTGKETLRRVGMVEITDANTSQQFPLVAKAFRHAPAKCMGADIVRIKPARAHGGVLRRPTNGLD